MTVDDIRQQVNVALKEFGRYQFSDKRSREVMDLDPILTHLKQLKAEDARAMILELARSPEPMCAVLAQDLVSDLDCQPEAWWLVLMDDPAMEDLY